MSIKSAFKVIGLTLLVLMAVGIFYVIESGFAIIRVKTPDTNLWLPVPIAFGELAGKMVTLPLQQDQQLKELWKYREEFGEILRQLPGLPDANFVEVQNSKEQVRIFKQGDSFCVQVTTPDEKVNIRLPVETVARLAETFDDPAPDLGDFIASLKGGSAGDLVYVKTNNEEVRISIW
ncbi:MAG: hypothetical protein U0V70_20435 [Terriglobia bacterium]